MSTVLCLRRESTCFCVCGCRSPDRFLGAHVRLFCLDCPSHSDSGKSILQSESLQVTQHVCGHSDLLAICPPVWPHVVSSGRATARGEETPQLARLWVVACVSARSMVTVPDWDTV